MSEKFFTRKVFWGLLVLTFVNLIAAISVLRKEGLAAVPGIFGKPKGQVAKILGPYVQANKYPSKVEWDGPTKVEYTLDPVIQSRIQDIFERHRPDYGTAVALDATTGEILTMVSYSRRTNENLALQASFPAASIFKIVTAAAAIDQNKLSSETRIGFGGGNHTLYKKNVEADRGRWFKFVTVKDAFARSINTVFAKMGLNFVGPEVLAEYAERFKFNRDIESDIPIEAGYAHIPTDDEWAVAEAASGYTRKNTMSPIQGALMAAAIANDGIMPEPYLVRNMTDEKGRTLYQASPETQEAVLDEKSVNQMRRLMAATITQGTSRKSFRSIVQGARIAGLELGGKTGSLTGTEPKGKYDWFVGYGRSGNRKIAIAVMTINERVWRIRSSQVAADFFRHYFKISTPVRRLASYSKHKRSRRAYN